MGMHHTVFLQKRIMVRWSRKSLGIFLHYITINVAKIARIPICRSNLITYNSYIITILDVKINTYWNRALFLIGTVENGYPDSPKIHFHLWFFSDFLSIYRLSQKHMFQSKFILDQKHFKREKKNSRTSTGVKC